jgi:hypothetical protein
MLAFGLMIAGCRGDALDGDLYGEWNGPADAEARVFVYRGFEHCGTQKVSELQVHDTAVDTRVYYLRDPSGSMAHHTLRAPEPHSGNVDALPDGARESGFERAGTTLWFAADYSAAYLIHDGRIERWPRWEWSLTYCD